MRISTRHSGLRYLLYTLPACGGDGGRGSASEDGASGVVSVGDATASATGTAGTTGDSGASGETGASTGSASADGTEGSGTTGVSGGSGVKFDVPALPDLGDPMGCGGDTDGGDGVPEFSYIWIANSAEGTVSKIDTKDGVEKARYVTGPGSDTQPSRTSVNLYGDAAVSNRGPNAGGQGSVSKIAARLDDCVDTNMNGMMDTSTGPADVKPWGADECVLWNVAIPSDGYTHGPRPTAWEGLQENGRPLPNARLWIGWYDYTNNTGWFRRLDGTTGQTLDEVSVPGWSGESYGPYGGAVNAAGDLWVTGWASGPAVRIDAVTVTAEVHPGPGGFSQFFYGMAVDADGEPWVAGSGTIYHFHTDTNTWATINAPAGGSFRGLQVDRENRAWIANDSPCGVTVVDTLTDTILAPSISLPGCGQPVGVSIDVEGYVWVVDQSASAAFKVDPDSYQTVLTVTGLVGPYTYSDMTGAGLSLVANPPG